MRTRLAPGGGRWKAARSERASGPRFARHHRASRAVLRRLSVAVLLSWVALGVADVLPAFSTAAASRAGEDPDEAILPSFPGFTPSRLDGVITVDGRARSTSILRLDAGPDEVIAYLRRRYEEEPVDLVEREEEGQRILLVWDVHQGRSTFFSARARGGGGTELIRSWAPLSSPSAPALLGELTAGLEPISRIDDRLGGSLVTTATFASELRPEELAASLERDLRAGGWSVGVSEVEPSGEGENASAEGSARYLEARRGAEGLILGFGDAGASASLLYLRYERAIPVHEAEDAP